MQYSVKENVAGRHNLSPMDTIDMMGAMEVSKRWQTLAIHPSDRVQAASYPIVVAGNAQGEVVFLLASRQSKRHFVVQRL